MMKRLLFFFLVMSSPTLWSQQLWLNPNRGQWDEEILYSVDLSNGYMYIDKNGFTYALNDALSHKHHSDKSHDHPDELKCQVIKTHFHGSNWGGGFEEGKQSPHYRNYYLGNNPNKWKSGVHSLENVLLKDFYQGIHLSIDAAGETLKYTLIVEPGIDPYAIDYRIEGSDMYELIDGDLRFHTRFGTITEKAPVAWTEKDGLKKNVPVQFALENGSIKYVFPKGYDNTATLIIDPSLVFSSFTGATADNWGMTATPDEQGNLYAGGIVFAGGGSYPTVTGSFDLSFNGGYNYTYTQGANTYSMNGFDAAISKFNASGSNLIFSTYLGGAGNEAPHSLVTDENNNLYVFGVTGSADFPTVGGCFDVSFNGGPVVAENELGYNGADLFVSRFNVAGSALVGSTFVGGTGTDGINIGNLNYNYGDSFRGEIIAEGGFVYVSSTTRSTNFPTLGAGQGFLNGAQDAVIFKMNSALTVMSWSTYFGGSGSESGNSVQLASNGAVYVSGGTDSGSLPVTSGNDLTFNGGVSDGYLLKIAGSSSLFQAGTFMGMNEYDQAYFVQLDPNDEVYVYGQTESSWPISPGVYGNPNSGQFIRKYNNGLTNILWSTTIGAGTGHPEISPTAFLVSDCYEIYISGWGGTINSSYSNQAFFSTSNGFPVTLDAYQLTTNGSNFYIAVLEPNASALQYGTYFGGSNSSYNHVDGGTSRFDKSGRIYHAVCGACGGQDFGFTSTPGVWSPTNNSFNCNLAAFKFELSEIDAIVTNPQTIICLPNPVIFNNNSSNGNSFFWDFGDNTTSTDVNPSHVYPGPGNYTVTLVVSDSAGCYTPDSVEFVVQIGDFQGGVVQPPNAICPGESIQLEAYGGSNYQWSPANLFTNPNIPEPVVSPNATTTYTVIVSDSCGADTLQVTVQVFDVNTAASNDTSICIGESVQLQATGGVSYQWSPATGLNNASVSNPIATPTDNVSYTVDIVTADGCEATETVNISVFFNPPVPVIPDTVEMCSGTSVAIQVSGASSYAWSPNYEITPLIGPNVVVSPDNDFTYYCDFTNACGTTEDSVHVDVIFPEILAGNDTTICPGESAVIWASGGVLYYWYPSVGLSAVTGSQVMATPGSTTTYFVIGTDEAGCQDTAQVEVELYPTPFIQTVPDVYAIYGDIIQLGANSTTPGDFVWSPADYLSCTDCQSPVATPSSNITYTVTYTDINGCSATDGINIYFIPILYVPNTFTPDDDEFNSGFQIVGSNISSFELLIYNRWGELIYTMTSFDDFWDGTYKGLKCQDGTYIWAIRFTDFQGINHERTGHVNLLR